MVQNTGDVRYLLYLDSYEELPDINLLDQWHGIYEEWSDIIGGNRSGLNIIKIKMLIAAKHKFNYQMTLLNTVKTLPVPELTDLLKGEGYKINPDNLKESFHVIYGKLMRQKAQIEIDEKEEIKEESGDFEAVIVAVEKFQGYHFDEDKMTVRRFANIYKNYKDDGTRRQNNSKGITR
jgi:hypothetical protein